MGVVTNAYASWRQEIEQLAEKSNEFTKNLLGDLATAGDLPLGPQIRNFLQRIPGATREEAQASFFGITGGAPSLSLQRRAELTREAVGVAPLVGVEETEQFGRLAGRIAVSAPGKSANDVSDIAQQIRASLGDRIAQALTPGFSRTVETLKRQGLDVEEALGFTIAGTRAEVRPSSLANITANISGKAAGSKGGADFAAASTEERLRQLLADPALAERVLGATNAAKLALIKPSRFQAETAALRDAQASDLLARDIANAERTDPTFFRSRQAQIRQERADIPRAEGQREFQALVDERAAQTAESGGVFGGSGLADRSVDTLVSKFAGLIDRIADSSEPLKPLGQNEVPFTRGRQISQGPTELIEVKVVEQPREPPRPTKVPAAGLSFRGGNE